MLNGIISQEDQRKLFVKKMGASAKSWSCASYAQSRCKTSSVPACPRSRQRTTWTARRLRRPSPLFKSLEDGDKHYCGPSYRSW